MKALRRITPEEVLAAFRRHPEIKPTRGSYFSRRNGTTCCCAIGVLVVDKFGKRNSLDVTDLARSTFNHSYRVGFTCGFDACDHVIVDREDAVMKQGFADGRAVAAAVFGEMR